MGALHCSILQSVPTFFERLPCVILSPSAGKTVVVRPLFAEPQLADGLRQTSCVLFCGK